MDKEYISFSKATRVDLPHDIFRIGLENGNGIVFSVFLLDSVALKQNQSGSKKSNREYDNSNDDRNERFPSF